MSPVRNREVSENVLRTELRTVIGKGYDVRPIIILQGRRTSTVPDELVVDDMPVMVRECGSTLAIYDTMYREPETHGLVIITDCSEEQLGSDILNYVVGHQVRRPKAWESLKNLFNATSISHDLYSLNNASTVAEELLHVLPGAPTQQSGETLTTTSIFTAVAQQCLNIETPSSVRDVLRWSRHADAANKVKKLARQDNAVLQGAYFSWHRAILGSRSLLINPIATGSPDSIRGLMPLCLATHILLQTTTNTGAGSAASLIDDEDKLPGEVKLALAKLQHRWSASSQPELETLQLLGEDANDLICHMLHKDKHQAEAHAVLTETDTLLNEVTEVQTYQQSTLSPAAWKQQVHRCAQALAHNTPGARDLWHTCSEHILSCIDTNTTTPLKNALRLRCWLDGSRQEYAPTTLADTAQRHLNTDAWVDAAAKVVHHGDTDSTISSAYAHLLQEVEATRDTHDREFAQYLIKHGATSSDLTNRGVLGVENILNDVLLPLTAKKPTLLLVLDGMSGEAAVTIAKDLQDRSWHELTPGGNKQRLAALSVLPSLTEHSRTSLLCGALTSGDSSKEKTGFKTATGNHNGIVFHKRDFREARAGHKLSEKISRAIADTTEHGTVACVLNTIDDSLDKGNPSGTTWTIDSVTYLPEVLKAARAAGRVVVITADHGHILERPNTRYVATPEATSARSKPYSGEPENTEVLVAGDRVLPVDEDGIGHAILAVHERLRYASGKEGYHGGGSPAEVVVPVMAFTQDLIEPLADESPWGAFDVAPPTHPGWWHDANYAEPAHSGETGESADEPSAPAAAPAPATGRVRKSAPQQTETLFDPTPDTAAPSEASAAAKSTSQSTSTKQASTPPSVGKRITASDTYKTLPESSRNRSQAEERLIALVDALSQAPGNRLPKQHIAQELNLALPRLSGALSAIEALLNVEGYPILTTEDDTVILDVPLLRDQFELPKS